MKQATTKQFRNAVRLVAARAGVLVLESWTNKASGVGLRNVGMRVQHTTNSQKVDLAYEVEQHLYNNGLVANTRDSYVCGTTWMRDASMYLRGTCAYTGK